MMDREEFEDLLCAITASTIANIVEETGMSEEEATDRFIRSRVYALLEQEETKVWHVSAATLAALFVEEMETGKADWSEVFF